MKLDINKFLELEELGYLRKAISSCGKLISFKYTDKTTYEKYWNEYTRVARGIVLEKETGEVVCFAPPKFFNLFEMPETKLENLPEGTYEITEKMDGSAGLIYFYDNEWRINTLGSFQSDQAVVALDILKKYNMSQLNIHINLFVEIIYPENKIIVNYGDKKELILLTAFNNVSGTEFTWFELEHLSEIMNMNHVNKHTHSIEELIKLQKQLPKDKEGFVVKFHNNLRVKFKGEEYCRVHKMISNMTPLAFWESMEDGVVRKDYIAQLPEEFRIDADVMTSCLEADYKYILSTITIYDMSVLFTNKIDLNDKRQIGVFLQSKDNGLKHPKAIFPYLTQNNKALNKYIMNTIRPHGNELREWEEE